MINKNLVKFFCLVLVMMPISVNAEIVSFTLPTWGDIDQTNPVLRAGSNPSPSDRIGIRGNDTVLTAFQFCTELGYDYISSLADGQSNPVVTFENNEWRERGEESSFLRIDCDDGIVASSTNVTNIMLDVPDYTDQFNFMMIIYAMGFFMAVIYAFRGLVKLFI
jgi:hypothetical protein